jgi:hypothetical protein
MVHTWSVGDRGINHSTVFDTSNTFDRHRSDRMRLKIVYVVVLVAIMHVVMDFGPRRVDGYNLAYLKIKIMGRKDYPVISRPHLKGAESASVDSTNSRPTTRKSCGPGNVCSCVGTQATVPVPEGQACYGRRVISS